MRTSPTCKRLTSIAVAAGLALLSCAALAQSAKIDRIVSFGASLSDSGNAFIWLSDPAHQSRGVPLNKPPYDTLDDYAVPDGPYATGGRHFSNGATWVEGLARHFALAGNARPAFGSSAPKASNYAVGGARGWADYPCRYNLPAQLLAYQADFAATSPATLVTMEIGGNDVRDALVAASQGGDTMPYLVRALAGWRDYLAFNLPGADIRILDTFGKLNAILTQEAIATVTAP